MQSPKWKLNKTKINKLTSLLYITSSKPPYSAVQALHDASTKSKFSAAVMLPCRTAQKSAGVGRPHKNTHSWHSTAQQDRNSQQEQQQQQQKRKLFWCTPNLLSTCLAEHYLWTFRQNKQQTCSRTPLKMSTMDGNTLSWELWLVLLLSWRAPLPGQGALWHVVCAALRTILALFDVVELAQVVGGALVYTLHALQASMNIAVLSKKNFKIY